MNNAAPTAAAAAQRKDMANNILLSPGKKRSLSDGSSAGGQPVLSPSPKIRESQRRMSKDDTAIADPPSTPLRPALPRGLSIQMPPRGLMSPSSRPPPLSPKLDRSSIYGSPASVLPRRSRGLDFSRAATNLHHSTLAKSSPDASPTASGRAMNIPGRGGSFGADHAGGGAGHPDRMAMAGSLGSVAMLPSDSSESSSDDDDLMEDDEPIMTTPQVNKSISTFGNLTASPGTSWMTAPSPAVSSLMHFQRARLRHGKSRKSSSSGSGSSKASPISRSPPSNGGMPGLDRRRSSMHSRRESISWAANQLHISGNESDDGVAKGSIDTDVPSTPGVIRRAVTRRGNLLPKTKTFARIQAALAEESAPVDSDVRREADVIRQVRESDIDDRRYLSAMNTANSSPLMAPNMAESLGDIPEDDFMGDLTSGLSSSFKEHAIKKGKDYWEQYDKRTPPPTFPPPFPTRGSTSTASDDMSMSVDGRGASEPGTTTPQPSTGVLPTAAEITRRITSKRRRGDDDFDLDPTILKRRAVSPGLSAHNSPITQSPMQRDTNPWASASLASSTAPRTDGHTERGSIGSLPDAEHARTAASAPTKRVGMQGMADTNDGIMRMSIE